MDLSEACSMNKMIAYCGLNCEKCDAYIATKNNDNALREKTAKRWSKLNNAPITAEMINCNGCRGNGVKTIFCESMCQIRKCASKNDFETCGDCSKMNECKTLAEILSHSQDAKENLLKK